MIDRYPAGGVVDERPDSFRLPKIIFRQGQNIKSISLCVRVCAFWVINQNEFYTTAAAAPGFVRPPPPPPDDVCDGLKRSMYIYSFPAVHHCARTHNLYILTDFHQTSPIYTFGPLYNNNTYAYRLCDVTLVLVHCRFLYIYNIYYGYNIMCCILSVDYNTRLAN